MSRLSRSARLLKNAEAALLSAIEIYNKPTFAYREETFAILALNAWELLIKAKLLAVNNNQPQCLYVPISTQTKAGGASKKVRFKKNRTGNRLTMGIEGCIVALEKKGVAVPDPLKKNLDALTEIRDNAVHYLNASPDLAKQVLEIGTAAVRNFIESGKRWLDLDLSSYSLYLMPIGFMPSHGATAIMVSNEEKKVVSYLANLMRESQNDPSTDFHVSLDLHLSFKRTPSADAVQVIISNSPDAMPVTISEEDVLARYPWNYAELTKRLKARYIDFTENAKYHEIRKKLAADPKFMKRRYLDPASNKGLRKDLYNPNIVTEFDKSYTLKK